MLSDQRESLRLMIESVISESVNTSMPASIMSYDAAKNRATVKPDLPKALNNGEALEAPKIVEIPIAWPSACGGKASLTMPLKAGDPLVNIVQQRSLEGWLDGKRTMPDDPRQFDLSDSIAIPGGGHTGTVANPDDVVLKFDKSFVQLKNDNSLVVGNDQATITIDNAGNMTIKAKSLVFDVSGPITMKGSGIGVQAPGGSFTLESHRHTNVQSGPVNSGPPV